MYFWNIISSLETGCPPNAVADYYVVFTVQNEAWLKLSSYTNGESYLNACFIFFDVRLKLFSTGELL